MTRQRQPDLSAIGGALALIGFKKLPNTAFTPANVTATYDIFAHYKLSVRTLKGNNKIEVEYTVVPPPQQWWGAVANKTFYIKKGQMEDAIAFIMETKAKLDATYS